MTAPPIEALAGVHAQMSAIQARINSLRPPRATPSADARASTGTATGTTARTSTGTAVGTSKATAADAPARAGTIARTTSPGTATATVAPPATTPARAAVATLPPFADALTAALATTDQPAVGGLLATGTASAVSGTASTGANSGVGTVTGASVVADAHRYLGVPYVWGGQTPQGLDCSGLVQLTFHDLGITLPRVAADQAHQGSEVPSLAQARPGDLLAFGDPAHHIAIYVGDTKMLESPEPGKNVHITEVNRTPSTIRRIVPPAGSGLPSSAARVVPGALGTLDTTGIPRAVPLATLSLSGIPVAAAGASAVPLTVRTPVATAAVASVGSGPSPARLAAGRGTSTATSDAGAATNAAGTAVPRNASQLEAAGISPAVAAYANQFAAAEIRFGLPSGLLAAVAQQESSGDAGAVSPAGAQGLMQLMPGTARALGVGNSFDPRQAIPAAARLLADNLKQFHESVPLALAAYNAGPNAVTRYGGIPPYRETQDYVRIVTATMAGMA